MEYLLCGGFKTGISIIQIFDIIMITIEYCAIFTFIALICSDVNLSAVIGLILAFIMLIASWFLIGKVNERKYYYAITSIGNEIVEKTIIEENPTFPGEKKAKIYKTILYIMPSGQASMLLNKLSSELDVENRRDYNNNILLLCSVRCYDSIYFVRNCFI